MYMISIAVGCGALVQVGASVTSPRVGLETDMSGTHLPRGCLFAVTDRPAGRLGHTAASDSGSLLQSVMIVYSGSPCVGSLRVFVHHLIKVGAAADTR